MTSGPSLLETLRSCDGEAKQPCSANKHEAPASDSPGPFCFLHECAPSAHSADRSLILRTFCKMNLVATLSAGDQPKPARGVGLWRWKSARIGPIGRMTNGLIMPTRLKFGCFAKSPRSRENAQYGDQFADTSCFCLQQPPAVGA